MTKLNLTILNIIFFTPLILFLWLRYREKIKKERRFLSYATFFAIIIFFLVEPIGTYSGAWRYDYKQTLGPHIFGVSLIEMLAWSILVVLIVAITVATGAEKEERGENFFIPNFLKRKK
jgi:uncharacterized membrane protein YoaT (DUF817 family)